MSSLKPVSMEISHTADKSASRMTVETPVDSEYCAGRQTLQAQLKQHAFLLVAPFARSRTILP
jgi:hypothetical protein